jgi:hypothetical protein
MKESVHEYDVFADDLIQEEGDLTYAAIGLWGITLLHVMKVAFVIYSGAHNIQAALIATGNNTFALVAQIIGVLVLEATISAIYMAGMAGRITGRLQSVIAAFFWVLGMTMASAGIVADSRLHAGYELGPALSWYLTTGLFLAPVIMVVGAVLVVFTDPVLSQKIANSRDRAGIEREKVRTAVLIEKAAHKSQRIVHNIRLGAQKQMAIEAKKYYQSEEVQGVLRETAVAALQDVMRQAGIHIPASQHGLVGRNGNDPNVKANGAQPAPFGESNSHAP